MQHTSLQETSGSSHPFFRPPLRSAAAQDQRHLLRTEYDEMQAAIMVKAAHLNALAPISYLPPEILEKIFYHVSRLITPRLYYCCEEHVLCSHRLPKKVLRSLVNITHVCSRWRQVAIQNCRLWTRPPLELGPEWMRKMLLRSESAPLVIKAHQDGPILYSAMIQPIYEHLSHIQILHIASSHYVLDQLFPKLILPSPMLVSLTLDHSRNSWEATSPTSRVMSRLPFNLFAEDAPELRRVSLINCIVPWDCAVFQNLVSLHINVPDPDGPLVCAVDGTLAPLSRSKILPSMSQLLAVLRASPSLQSLGLQDILPHASSIPFHHSTLTSDDIHLPDLRDFRLVGTVLDCAALLSRVEFPIRTDLRLEWSFEDAVSPEAECAAVFNALEHHFLPADYQDSRPFDIFFYSEVDSELDISTRLCRITVSTPMDADTRTDFLRRYFAIIPLAEVFTLTFDDDGLLASSHITDIFAHERLHGPCIVNFRRGRFDAFCAALSEQQNEPAPGHLARFSMFHSLPILEIHGLDFTEFTEDEMVYLQEDLLFLLQEREDHGSPIDRVEFSHCPGLSQAWTDALRVVESTEICFIADEE